MEAPIADVTGYLKPDHCKNIGDIIAITCKSLKLINSIIKTLRNINSLQIIIIS